MSVIRRNFRQLYSNCRTQSRMANPSFHLVNYLYIFCCCCCCYDFTSESGFSVLFFFFSPFCLLIHEKKKKKKKKSASRLYILIGSYFTTGPLTRGGFEILCLLRQISTSFSSAIWNSFILEGRKIAQAEHTFDCLLIITTASLFDILT